MKCSKHDNGEFKQRVKFLIHVVVLLLLGTNLVQAQNTRKEIRQGVKAYESGDFSDAEVRFRKAGDQSGESFIADYNTGAALYKQEKYEETAKQYESLAQSGTDPEELAKVWHNMGNSLLEGQQYQASIDAYKNSLRLNPDDMDTKYNLAYARKKLNEQQQNQQNQDQQKQDQQQNQDQDQQKQDQQQNQDQAQDQQQQQPQDQQARPQQISKEDAERMLSAIQQKEKDVKEKVDKEKAAVAKVKTEKDW